MPYSLTKANQDQLLEAALAVTGSRGWFKDAVAFGAKRHDDSDIRAAGVFQNFAGGAADLHLGMIGHRMTRDLIEAYLTVSFHPKMLGLSQLFVHISVNNPTAQRAAIAVGFQFEYRRRAAMPDGEDAVVLSLTPGFGNEEAQSSAA